MKNKIKRVAAINDMSGIGRCSLTAVIPILSTLGIQCCPFPTAILSNQTEYSKFTFLDLTDNMKEYKNLWKGLDITFDCIYSGFLGSESQINIVSEFVKNNHDALIVIDPVMGDNGIIYDTYTKEMCSRLKELVKMADLVTPNLTEACILTEKDYNSIDITEKNLITIAKEIINLGPKKVIITGIISKNEIWNFAYDKELKESFIVRSNYNNKSYSGTGDIFTSIVVGMLLRGNSLKESIEKASKFIYKVTEFTSKYDTDTKEGIMFELFLRELIL
ncbi:pyridoxamine kinase [Clostridium septicum]|uniref:pyridoxamine kinase n=1 Tax=Clostridium septicum TaxID=1504 RepID=UPI003218057F